MEFDYKMLYKLKSASYVPEGFPSDTASSIHTPESANMVAV